MNTRSCFAISLVALVGGCGGSPSGADGSTPDVAAPDVATGDVATGDDAGTMANAVDTSLFLPAGLNGAITEVVCTLSDGSSSTCWQITTKAEPSDHATGPWCPTQISDGADQGGIWPEDGIAHDVSGAFVDTLSTFYDDPMWQMANPDGSINFTETAEECAAAARPDVDPALQNHCVQCLPSYIPATVENTYVIPQRPTLAASPVNITGNVGVAFNGIRFDGPAPTDAILGAYTLAPFDDCGGHINLNAGYHYHAVTSGCVTTLAQDDGHAGMIGYAMDGFPMYEMRDADGTEPEDLDGCRGHTDAIRGYHYHVTGPGENMILGCWSGLVVQAGGAPGGGGVAVECATPDATICCGDGICDGPETAATCAADCS